MTKLRLLTKNLLGDVKRLTAEDISKIADSSKITMLIYRPPFIE